ncbi:TetR/AcrR family transcriptional regulator [Amycolatopsis suaedae]|uniref:TetR/AcrR family transcriptional regulator n=1 Tax=Amycolatopsis suaedae TaxID=2510978 RepID=A0A4V2ELU6_9PSEU|nr:TetR/AcrR family transcriptional regulator [Amycolatopsis suaedae]RZQ62795.1 TetR/AcrR family transcriptional regulator [Amycolatopsis suaedae]
MARPRTHDEALRLRLLDRAGELLSAEGAKALSLRKLAAEVGTSTTAVYSLFGSKLDLVNALFVEGFRRFGARMAGVETTGDVAEDLVRLGLAYRESALADPHLYTIMFTQAVPGFEPGDDAAELALGTLRPLRDLVTAGIEAGVFRDVDPDVMTMSAWGLAHGLVSLEVSGSQPDTFDFGGAYETALRMNVRGWLA